MARYHSAPVIEDEAAYEAAIRRRIKANMRKTLTKKWEALEDRTAIWKFIESRTPEHVKHDVDMGKLSSDNSRDLGFIAACYVRTIDCGCPADNQLDAIRRMMAQQAQRRQEAAARDAGSQHIGTVGERRSFTLTIAFTAKFDGMFGTTYITGFKDEAGNVIVYKGSKEMGAKGETITFKATIKEHGEREGVKQTLLSRPVLG